MSTAPNHVELQDLLPEAALGLLTHTDMARLLEHVRDCERCAGQLHEYRDVVAALALAAPPTARDAIRTRRLRSRLLARIKAEPRSQTLPGHWWLGWAVAAGLGGVLLIHHSVHRPLDYGWFAAGVLVLVLVAVGVYAGVQRGRVNALRARLGRSGAELEGD